MRPAGRAFGNRRSAEELPIIIVGRACFHQFETGRKKRKGLLGILPDSKMKKLSPSAATRAAKGKPLESTSEYPTAGDEFNTGKVIAVEAFATLVAG